MDEPSEIQQRRIDELPHEAASDPPLSLQRRSFEPRGAAPRFGLAALAVVLLLAMMGVALAFAHYSRQADTARPDNHVQAR
ncbi:MAG: hypothetical protein KGO51_11415 [Alphaproteobacteria bacterium]|nr:hypothetical protein [Alphaproteobacteria bacterium]